MILWELRKQLQPDLGLIAFKQYLACLDGELEERREEPVRLEVEESIDRYVLDLLVRELKISEAEVYPLPGPLDLTGLFGIGALDRPELKYPKFIAGTHRDLAEVESASPPDIFAALRERDVLLHHPYDSFSTSVQAFLEQVHLECLDVLDVSTSRVTASRVPGCAVPAPTAVDDAPSDGTDATSGAEQVPGDDDETR